MIEFLLNFKWLLLIVAEVLAWITTFTMFLARYWWESKIWFWISFILSMITGIGIQISIAVLHLLRGKGVGVYEVVVILVVIYGFTYGKKHVKALDHFVMTWVRKRRSPQG